MTSKILLATGLLIGLSACRGASISDQSATSSPEGGRLVQTWATIQPDLELSRPPYRQVHANWKQRLDQPYVFVEYTGSYTETGRLLPAVHAAMRDQGLEPSGPPFALFYDDPGRVPADQLVSRACVPVEGIVSPRGSLLFDVLPSTTVVYAFVTGPYPDVPMAYPGLLDYMRTMGWRENGPIRETYLIPPDSVQSFDQLTTEVQLPVTFAE
jgi:effector-binding domain-containing protein